MDFKQLTNDISGERLNQSMISARKVAKWEQTGLLEGLKGNRKTGMARLLENQAMSMLNEAGSDTSDIKGFQAIAFPLVRRAFGHLLAQEIVSVQPMALPSGLLFWLDYTFGTRKAGTGRQDFAVGGSIFGDPVSPLTGGADAVGGHYYLHNSYTQREATGSVLVGSSASVTAWSELEYDPELSSSLSAGQIFKLTIDLDDDVLITNIDQTAYRSFAVSGAAAALGASYAPIRRHNRYNTTTKVLTVYYSGSASPGSGGGVNSGSAINAWYVKKDALSADTTGTQLNPAFEYAFDNADIIPEIDIKVASMPVTSNSRKVKVRWTPELAQDLNAYHSVDAEAELSQIMADQIALDIDTEILVDMVNTATAAKYYWDRRPGFFVDKLTGAPVAGPSFTGNVQEWYTTLLETVLDVSNTIHRKTLRAGANFIVTSPDVCTMLENLVAWHPVLDVSDPAAVKFSMGMEKAGTLSNRFTVYKAPQFYRNILLVGHKGEDWLTTGYVYAPYIPLIVTPTIYEAVNLTPTKGVMTRYAKQVVRGDMYGLVVVKGMGIF